MARSIALWGGGLVLAAAIVLGAVYAMAGREDMSAAAFREGSGYSVAPLAEGATVFLDAGPRDGPVIVILHGATLGSMAYRAYVAPFTAAGYRVVLYDQLGRGFSDRPDGRLKLDDLRRQLHSLLDHLEIERAHIYGVSMGAAVAARFAAAHPERVEAVSLQVPLIAGADAPMLRLARLPLFDRWFARVVLVPAIVARGESFGAETDAQRAVAEHFRAQFAVRGTETAMLSLFAGDALSSRLGDHAAMAAAGLPVQFIYATDDPEIDPASVETAIALYPQADVHRFTGGHFFSAGREAELAGLVAGFFAR